MLLATGPVHRIPAGRGGDEGGRPGGGTLCQAASGTRVSPASSAGPPRTARPGNGRSGLGRGREACRWPWSPRATAAPRRHQTGATALCSEDELVGLPGSATAGCTTPGKVLNLSPCFLFGERQCYLHLTSQGCRADEIRSCMQIIYKAQRPAPSKWKRPVHVSHTVIAVAEFLAPALF